MEQEHGEAMPPRRPMMIEFMDGRVDRFHEATYALSSTLLEVVTADGQQTFPLVNIRLFDVGE